MLPKIEYPLYDIYIKSLDRNVKFRPFLVKEEKILLIAKESKEVNSIQTAIKQIITNCAQEPLDVESLPIFDIEMIFVKLRAKSVGESIKMSFNCQNVLLDGSVCNADTDYTINLDKVVYSESSDHNPNIMLTDKIGIKLKYPNINSFVNIDENEIDTSLKELMGSIEYIFDNDSVTYPKDCTEEKLLEFIENISTETFLKIREFFNSAPKVVLDDNVKCSKCGFEHTIHTEGLLDFFF